MILTLNGFIEDKPKKKELNLVKDKVEDILKVSEKARNSDKSLISIYLRKYHNIEIDEDFLKEIPSFESITRVRRKFQELDLYCSDNQIAEKKKEYEEEVKEWVKDGY